MIEAKVTEQKNGAWTVLDKERFWFSVKLYNPRGELWDKVRCDTKAAAMEYLRHYNKIAKQF